jgi:hypothetical protein
MTELRLDRIERARELIAQDPEAYASDPERVWVASGRIAEELNGEDGGEVREV